MDMTEDAEHAFSRQDYSPAQEIDGVVVLDVRRWNDDGGSFTELGRLDGGLHVAFPGFQVKQMNYSEMDSGAIKAFHLHPRQTDVWFVPPGDKMLLVLLDVRDGSPSRGVHRRLVLGDGTSRLVRIPPGVAHGVKNLAPVRGRIIYFVDTHFSPVPDECEEGRLPWDFAATRRMVIGVRR
jgi:dTDP-4-dehydrorhamnose 3,5-epimerase